MAEAQLAVRDVHGWYGESHILHGMTFDVNAGEVVTLLGRNGAGKTTTMRAIMGMLAKRKGSIRYEGRELIALKSNRIARQGIAYCPEERGIFSSLNVRENLMLPPQVKDGGMTIEEIYAIFPNLQERSASQGTKLSGGEQQMLAIARILRTGAKLLLLDEPTEGWRPSSCSRSAIPFACCASRASPSCWWNRTSASPRRWPTATTWSSTGRVIDMIPNSALEANREKLKTYLGV